MLEVASVGNSYSLERCCNENLAKLLLMFGDIYCIIQVYTYLVEGGKILPG